MRNASVALATVVMLCACQGASAPGPLQASSKSAALRTMEQIAIAAQKCWFVSKDPAFRPYRMANELDSYSGRPRILLVPAKSPESRPLLVVQAEGEPAKVDAFGPMMDEAAGGRIAADLKRWVGGSSACADAA